MTTIQDINSTIINGTFTNDQLDSIVSAVTFARNQIARKNKFSMTVGCKVKFVNNRTGQLLIGSVVKINRLTVVVNTGMTKWRVPANMLEITEPTA